MGAAFLSGRGVRVASERGEPVFDYMGSVAQIANPLAEVRAEVRGGSSAAPCKQCIGRGAVSGGLIPMRGNAGDFGFKLSDPLAQFGLRIGRKVFGCEATRGVAFGPRAIGFFHCCAASPAKRLAVNRRDGYSRSLRG
jgi:hypothetical protein